MDNKKEKEREIEAGKTIAEQVSSGSNSGGLRSRLEEKFAAIPERIRALRTSYRRRGRSQTKEGLLCVAFGIMAYLFGACRLPFGVSPLGIALLCASPSRILWIFVGLCASALAQPESAFIYIFAYSTALTVRILSRLLSDSDEGSSLFSENLYIRLFTSAVSAFMIGVYSVILGDFQVYQLWGLVLSLGVAPLATFAYLGCFQRKNQRFFELSVCLILASVSLSLRELQFIGISAGVFFTFFVTLLICRKKGIWQGAALGLICGLAYSPIFAPAFALAGMAAGALWNVSVMTALLGAGTSAMLWGFYVDGISAMSRLLPAIILSGACYLWAQKLSFFPAARDLLFSGRYCADMNAALIDREGRSETESRLVSLSEAFGSLSDIFYNLSERLSRPGLPELERVCDGVYDRYCPSCPNRDLCWGIEYAKSRELLRLLGEKLSTGGAAQPADLPEYMRRRCQALPGIVGEINERTAELYKLASSCEKTEIFAIDYAALSDILKDAEAQSRLENMPDAELSEALSDIFADYGFGEGGVSVYGTRRRRIVARGFDIASAGIGMKDLRSKVESAVGLKLGEPIIEIKEDFLTLRMSSARCFSARAERQVDNVGGEECGDTTAFFENCEDKCYALISDGEGKGRDAAFTSGVCSVFLKKMLGAGNRVPTVIKMLNSFVRSKADKCSATLDLMELDLLNGRAEFYKCGAAPSYVRRGDNLYKLAAQTVPLGILKGTDTAKLSFDAQKGDVIIMLSDGVTDGCEDVMWLLEILSSRWEEDLSAVAKRISKAARERGSRDDISVMLIKVE